MAEYGLDFFSELRAPADKVWRSVTSLAGINQELMPLLSMVGTDGTERLDQLVDGAEIDPLHVTLRLGGLVPIGSATIHIIELDRFRFTEQSDQPGMRSWQHARRIEPDEPGCTLLNRVEFTPARAGAATSKLIEGLFAFRHRNLRRFWNTPNS